MTPEVSYIYTDISIDEYSFIGDFKMPIVINIGSSDFFNNHDIPINLNNTFLFNLFTSDIISNFNISSSNTFSYNIYTNLSINTLQLYFSNIFVNISCGFYINSLIYKYIDFEVGFYNNYYVNNYVELIVNDNISNSLTDNVNVDLFITENLLGGYIYSDIYNSLCQLYSTIIDSTIISGSLTSIKQDIIAAVETISYMPTDCISAYENQLYLGTDSLTISGSINANYINSYCCDMSIDSYTIDVNLFPIKILNFSIDENNFSYDTFFSVDIIDDIYEINTNETYFTINGIKVSVIFSIINDGYRMSYIFDSSIFSIPTPITVVAHATDIGNNTIENKYYLTFGYVVDYKVDSIGYPINKQILVRLTAEDLASCPKTNVEAFWFETKNLPSNDLYSSIVGIKTVINDLSASIYPQSLAYFYGKRFTIEISASDYSGNKMPSAIYIFEIEND